ncbi:hypothetical protein GW17_00000331 [Ensete ventricosum]|nr:hypothetical protein GW17_00000331 [Ensete ventricosum]
MKQLWYVRGESQFSDHRPVYSLFSVQVDDEAKSGGVGTTASVTAAKSSGNSSSSSSSWGRVQAEELLLFTGTQSLYRFHKANIRKRDANTAATCRTRGMMPSQPPPFLRVAAHFAFSGSVPTGQPTRDPTRLSHAIRCSPQHRHRRNRSKFRGPPERASMDSFPLRPTLHGSQSRSNG